MIQNTAEAYETAKEEAEAYKEAAKEAILAEVGNGSEIKNMEEYLAYRKEFLKVA
jgi:predicted RNase H-like nuclease (RuvC/YqgF family)